MGVDRRQLHEEIVRVLSIMQRLAVIGLARLEQQRVASRPDGPWLGAHHAPELEATAADIATGHEHCPVDATELVVAAPSVFGTVLPIVIEEGAVVEHEVPAAC